MSAIAIGQHGRPRVDGVTRSLEKASLFFVVLAVLYGIWEGYRWLGIHFGWTHPFAVNDTTMPHIHDMVNALFQPTRAGGPLLVGILWRASLFTAKEAALGFAMGAVGGFALGTLLAHSRVLQRGFLPYVVASQTVPILAIAPMVVVWLASLHVTAWISVAVIAAYLTFFPVAINTLRGLHSADRRAAC